MDTTQLLKGVLDVAVLAVLDQEDGYGYDVVRRLRAAGLDDVADASVYGTLRRLFAAGPVGMRSRPLMTVALRVMGNLVTDADRDVVARVWRLAGRLSVRLDEREPFS